MGAFNFYSKLLKKVLPSIWFWWIFLTGSYLLLQHYFGYEQFSASSRVILFLGAFVPIGRNSLDLLYMLFPLSVIYLFIYFFVLKLIQKWFDVSNDRLFEKIILILGILFILTAINDFLIGSPFESLRSLITGKRPDYL